MEQEIVDYILQAQRHGLSEFEIKQSLTNVGWEAQAIEESFTFAKAAENKNVIHSPAQGQMRPAQAVLNTPSSNLNQDIKLQISPIPAEAAQPQNSSSGTTFAPPASYSMPFYKKSAFLASCVGLLLLAGGAFAYFELSTPSAEKVWSELLASEPDVFKNNFTFSYTSPQTVLTGEKTENMTFKISGDSSNDERDVNNLKSSSNLNVNVKSGPLGFELNLKYILLSKVFYLYLGDIPKLKEYFPDYDLAWVKLDIDSLKKYLNDKDIRSPEDNDQKSKQLAEELKEIWSDKGIVIPVDFLEKEKVNDVAVYHIQGTVNKTALKDALLKSINAFSAISSTSSPVMTAEASDFINAITSKIEVKGIDLWVGQKDHKLYKVTINTTAPSVSDLNLATGVSGTAKSRDAQRINDMRMMASALELYFNDKGQYPASDNGTPIALAPDYISAVPIAPSPKDGQCTDYYNGYWYEQKDGGRDFGLTFCLGEPTEGYASGVGMVETRGILGGIPCPAQENCLNNSPKLQENSAALISKMKFDAEISLDMEFRDYGQEVDIKAPEKFTDLMELIKSFGSAFGVNLNSTDDIDLQNPGIQ